MRAIIFANGQFTDPDAYRELVASADLLVAADGGTRRARAMGAPLDAVVGDMDSLDPALRDVLEAVGVRLVDHPAAKDETDLELALLYAVEQGASEIVILAAIGGRIDQTIANLFLLTHPALRDVAVRIVDGDQTAFLIRDEATIHGQPGDTVSLIPIGGDAHDVTADGLRWSLRDETLSLGSTRGVSNVLLGTQARVRVGEGLLLGVVIGGGFEK